MKQLNLIAILAVLAIVGLFVHTWAADGLLQNLGGTTSTGGSVPVANFLTNNSTVGWTNTGNIQGVTANATTAAYSPSFRRQAATWTYELDSGGLHFASTPNLSWAPATSYNSAGDPNNVKDTYLTRSGIGILLLSTNLIAKGTIISTNGFQMPTNYVAANFTPIPGIGFFAPSNDALYYVTQTATNPVVP